MSSKNPSDTANNNYKIRQTDTYRQYMPKSTKWSYKLVRIAELKHDKGKFYNNTQPSDINFPHPLT